MTCPGDQTLAAFVGGGIDDAQRAEVDDHMLACGLCRRSIAALARALPILDTLPQQRSLEDLRAAEGELRRYTIERVIGEGGMGIVVAARDRELQRSVAIKFSRRAANGGLHDEAARARFIREARVLAQLNHPNVITIYDTGVSTGELYIVMELVETGTLRDWLARERRPWRDILDVFVAAGRGLAIAHSAGIVHRDFKPANVLLGSDLRPRVSDFGLARPMERDDASGVVSHPMLALGSSMTDTSGVVGTPLYMAPEQRVGLPSDERTDQYSFCVALYEALYAKHPEPERIATSAVSHPCEGTVPGRIRKAIVRGLAKAPADRWPSMEALLAALTDARTSKRWWFAAGGLVAVVATAAVAFAVMRQSPSDLAALVCQGANQKLDGIWDEPRQGVIQAAFLATGRPSAIKAWSNVDRTLDRYTTAWAAMHSEACRATRVSGEQSEHVLELRMRCLETRRSSLAALVDAMSRPDATTLETVANAADQLSPVDDCANVSALAAVVPPPADPVARAHIDVVLAQLSTAWSLEQTGKPIEALRVARATMEPASQIGYAPLIAQVHEAVGQLARDTDDYKAAEQAFYAGLVAAETGKDEVTRAAILIHLARLVAIDLGRLDEGVRLGRQAEAAALAQPGNDELLARAFNVLSGVLEANGDLELALDYRKRELAVVERAFPNNDRRLAQVLQPLANLYAQLGKFDDAIEVGRQALAKIEAAVGPEHSDVGLVLDSLGSYERGRGRLAEARLLYERAIRIIEAERGPKSMLLGMPLSNFGNLLSDQGELRQALSLHQRSLTVLEAAVGSDHQALVQPLTNLGATAEALGDHRAALGWLERAVAVGEHSLGPEHPDLAVAYASIGVAHESLGARDQAIAALEHALRLYDRSAPSLNRAYAQVELAELLWDTKRDRPRALRLARTARDIFSADPASDPSDIKNVERWLAARTSSH